MQSRKLNTATVKCMSVRGFLARAMHHFDGAFTWAALCLREAEEPAAWEFKP
jgi:hypothetical protein